MKIAFFDLETTGLNHSTCDIIEIAMVLMGCDENYNLTKVLDIYTSFNDPGEPISEFIQGLTHITDDLVKSQKIDWDKVKKILDEADVIIAHNVKFDRGFLVAHSDYRKEKTWGCSLDMIDWKGKHFQSCQKLSHLAFEHGIVEQNAHRALNDVKLLIKLLKCNSKGNPGQTYFQELMGKIKAGCILFEVEFDYDYDKKEYVKGLGFRWNGAKKVWYKKVSTSEKNEVIKSLESKGLGLWKSMPLK